MSDSKAVDPFNGIAIIGMACRYPGAENPAVFWRNLRDGVESFTVLSDQELVASGVDPAWLKAPHFVKAGPLLKDVEWFDASFFEIHAREAEAMDPQHRLFLECAWEALENAGYDTERSEKRIGVYAGAAINSYLLNNLMAHRDFLAPSLGDTVHVTTVNDKDYLCTRISYKLNLKGPSFTVQSACSTSLVAVHLAGESLLNGECDMALAGGVTVKVPQIGYVYQEGGVLSPDGHCRAFDAQGRGTIWSSGMGMIVLKRLADALEDGDHIYAVIKGSAVNNDGSLKIGYTAPSVDGQAAVIAEALEVAGVDPGTITYIEAHGTGTELGDPIEISALTQAFRRRTARKGFCAIGSIKTNIGHSAAAAGVAGVIKTALALEHKQIPPSLNFERPNPKIDFENSPFYVNTRLQAWKTGDGEVRRAGVSSFGMGGTNAHIVLEEAPAAGPAGESRPWQLLLLSAKTGSALDRATVNLADHLRQNPDIHLADVAYTLQTGRRAFTHRRMLVCRERNEAVAALETLDPQRIFTTIQEAVQRPVAIMFTGQGAQYVDMGRELYRVEPTFREHMDQCCKLFEPSLGFDLREVLYPAGNREEDASQEQAQAAGRRLEQTAVAQPALFAVEYSLARLWMEWGVLPQAMAGHSIGEYVAACLAGVFSLQEGAALVATRGRLMQQMPGGAMLAVSLAEDQVRPLLQGALSLAAINGPSDCVVSGGVEAVETLEGQLNNQGIPCRRLHTSHAFHSSMLEPILKPFAERVGQVELKPPQIPFLSNTTGTWITAAQATSPEYWSRHLRETVRFGENVRQLLNRPEQVLLEVGPGRTLGTLVTRHPDKRAETIVLASLRHPQDRQSDAAFLLATLGRLWLAGVPVHWPGFSGRERRRRLPLPTYPFERQRYWLEAAKAAGASPLPVFSRARKDIAEWFYIPSWKYSAVLDASEQMPASQAWLVLADEYGLGARLARELKRRGQEVVIVTAGAGYARLSDREYAIHPGSSGDYDMLLGALGARGRVPGKIVHLWSITQDDPHPSRLERVERAQARGFYSLLFLAQAIGRQPVADPFQITVVSNNMQDVIEGEALYPEKATLLGPVRVMAQEYPNIRCRSVDVLFPQTRAWQKLKPLLLAELSADSSAPVVAYRGNRRWVQIVEPLRLDRVVKKTPRLKEGETCLITGGLGGIGLVLAEHLARTARAKLILTGRSAFPGRAAWEEWLASHDDQDGVSRTIRKLSELEELGSEILVVQADVCDREQMERALSRAFARFGRIHGVIHAAGVPGGGMIQRKTKEEAESILLPKVKGVLMLDELLGEDRPDFFVLCSSTTAVLGLFGQADYAAANAFLDAFAQHRAFRDGGMTTSINWGAWQEVGMAAAAVKKTAGAPVPVALSHPLLNQRIAGDANREIYLTSLSEAKQWILQEHRIMGKATLPGTAYLEMVRAAFKHQTGKSTIEIRDVCFLTPLVLEKDEERQIETILEKQEEGLIFSIRSRSGLETKGWREHARGKIVQGKAEAPKKYSLREIEAACHEQEVVIAEGERKSRTGLLEFGPRWGNLKRVKWGPDRGLALLELSAPFAMDTQLYALHPALLDVATSFLVSRYEGQYLPFSYGTLSIKGSLPGKIYSYARHRTSDPSQMGNLRFDITIMDAQGVGLVEIEDYTLLAVPKDGKAPAWGAGGTASLADSAPPPAHALSSGGSNSHEKAAAPGMSLQRELLKEGILPAEGVEAFDRILESRLPQVLVSTHDLQARMEQLRIPGGTNLPGAEEPSASFGPAHPRPSLRSAYVAPGNETEQALADIWQQFLRIERIGIHDNLFELGADSLLATRVIARIREAFQVDLPVASLFEKSTVAGLAGLIGSLRRAMPGPRPADQPPALGRDRGKV